MIYLGMIGSWQMLLALSVIGLLISPTIIALIDILKSKFTDNNKLIWVLVTLLGGFIGAILYFLIGRDQKVK